ncbi:MAG: hypothetical protein R2729_32240 [Bryobacteraceae bacterium]
MPEKVERRAIAPAIAAGILPAQDGFEALATLQNPELADFRDATPSPEGNTIYLTAVGPAGPGVFRVAAVGGPAATIYAGAPFVNPIGLAVSGDGQTVYVADSHAYAGSLRTGAVFSVTAAGVRPQAVRGGVELDAAGAGMYFSGRQPLRRPLLQRPRRTLRVRQCLPDRGRNGDSNCRVDAARVARRRGSFA